jgi:hypothetical protein
MTAFKGPHEKLMDSRFRGNDRAPNGMSTQEWGALRSPPWRAETDFLSLDKRNKIG